MAKVLHIVESLAAGGAERIVTEYASAHDSDRYTPEVCCVRSAGPFASALERAGVPVHELGRRFKLDPRPAFRLARIISRGGYDVVHDHNFSALSVGFPASLFSGVRALVRTEHNVTGSPSAMSMLLSRSAALREDAQIAVSRAVLDSHVHAGRIPPGRFVLIRNGISEERLLDGADRPAMRRELGVSDDDFVCLNIGSLTMQKNRTNLLEAVSRLTDLSRLRVLVVGSGPREAELKDQASRLGLERTVMFLGQRLDVDGLLAASDAFVLSSDWEGLPITVLEAMASGVPCISTSVGGVPEAITHGETGYLVPPGDPEALARGIRALALDPKLRLRLASSAREEFRGRFRAEQMVRQTEALYDLALSGHAARATGDRIKILYVIGQLGRGGAERQAAELVKRIPRDVFEPVVCCLAGAGVVGDEIEDTGVKVIYLDKSPGAFSGTSWKLMELIRRERPAAIHSYLFSAGWRSLVVGRAMRVPLIVSSARNVDIHSGLCTQMVDWMLAGLTDRMIANAEAVKDYVVRRHLVAAEKVHVIYNGVSLPRARKAPPVPPVEPPEKLPGPGEVLRPIGGGSRPLPSGRRVGMIASLTEKKDHATFFRAAEMVRQSQPDVSFLVVGDGPLRDDMSDLVQEMGLSDSVSFLGEADDIGSLLAGFQVSVLSSLKEGCSNVILESMAAGCPVVVTDVGGNTELVEDGAVGFVVPVGDAGRMADRIEQLLSDEGLRRKMGDAARARVDALFTAERMAERTADFYLSALERRVPGLLEWVRCTASREQGRAAGGPNTEDEVAR